MTEPKRIQQKRLKGWRKPPGALETRARRRIRNAVESRGYSVLEMEYEAPYDAGEMMGYGGGWLIELDRPYLTNTWPGDDLWGFNVDEVLAAVDYWLPPTEPCGCDRKHDPIAAARIKGDPKRPTHGPECDHHIKYRLRWWPKSDEETP